MSVNKYDLISAEQFNELVDKYSKYWADTYSSSGWSDVDKSLHVYGWGQNPVEYTVSQQETISSEQWNRLVSQINAGWYHIDGEAVFLPMHSSSAKITASDYVRLDNRISEIEPVKLEGITEPDTSILVHSSEALPWGPTMETVLKFSWPSYNDARYFFNSAGEIIFDFDAEGGVYGYEAWNLIFNEVVEVYVKSTETKSSGTATALELGGFYSINSTFKKLASFTNSTPVTSSDYGGYGDYSARRLNIYGRGIETANSFDIYIKIELVDDVAMEVKDTTITIYAGYAVPVDMPNASELASPVGVNFTVDTTEYYFARRQEPIISVSSDWTATSYPT